MIVLSRESHHTREKRTTTRAAVQSCACKRRKDGGLEKFLAKACGCVYSQHLLPCDVLKSGVRSRSPEGQRKIKSTHP
ncbi:hypothetical protein ACS0PU_009494 [Formica fusca]